jgi:hypothetical protein
MQTNSSSSLQQGNEVTDASGSVRRNGRQGLLNRLTGGGRHRAGLPIPKSNILDYFQTIRPHSQALRSSSPHPHNSESHTHDSAFNDMDVSDADTEATPVSTGDGDSAASTLPSLMSSSVGSSQSPLDAAERKSYASEQGYLQRESLANTGGILSQRHPRPSLSSIFEESRKAQGSQRSFSPKKKLQKRTRRESPTVLYKAVSKGAAYSDVRSILDNDFSCVNPELNGTMPPLHVGIERYDTPINTLQMLLESNPSAAGIRVTGQNAVHLLWMRFVTPAEYRSNSVKESAVHLRHIIEEITTGYTLHMETRAHHALEEYSDLQDLWSTMCSVIHAATYSCVGVYTSTSRSKRIVHDAIVLDCDPLFIRLASALYPHQLSEFNQVGHLPLHLAALHSSSGTLLTVLQLNPQATTQTDFMGKTVLHWAIEAGVTWQGGLAALIHANPCSLSTPCPSTGLLPCLLAASQQEANLTTIYCLLLENPIDICQCILDKEYMIWKVIPT